MSPTLVNILYFLLGATFTLLSLVIIRRKSIRRRSDSVSTQSPLPCARSLCVTPHPAGSAREALLANLIGLQPLFTALEQNLTPIPEISDAIIEINNPELMALWVKISKNPESIKRVFAMWGIKKEDEMQFQTQPHHKERYQTSDGGVPEDGAIYKVTSPCWILTETDKRGVSSKSVIFKGRAARK